MQPLLRHFMTKIQLSLKSHIQGHTDKVIVKTWGVFAQSPEPETHVKYSGLKI